MNLIWLLMIMAAMVQQMNSDLWQEILDQNELSGVLTDDSYNEDYDHEILLTVKEIREIADILKKFELLNAQ